MTSFELFQLFKFEKIYISYIFLYFCLLKYIICDKLHQFIKKIQIFYIKFGIIANVIIKLCKKSCRKEKVGGA